MKKYISVVLISAALSGSAMADESSDEFDGVFSTPTPHLQSLTDEQMRAVSGEGRLKPVWEALKWTARKGGKPALNGGKRAASATYNGGKRAASATYNGGKRAASATYNGGKRAASATYNGGKRASGFAWKHKSKAAPAIGYEVVSAGAGWVIDKVRGKD